MSEYFSHDYNTRNDSKIKRLLSKHGYLGYGLFWAIIEELYNNANALPTDYISIAYDLRTDEITIKSILHDFDLFVFDGEKFSSLSVQKRLEQRKEKSVNGRKAALSRWGKSERNANALQTQSEPNAIKEKESKEKEIKEDNNIIVFSFFESLKSLGAEENLIKDWMKVRKSKKATNTETAFNLFSAQVEKSGKSINEVLKICIEKDWKGFNSDWIITEKTEKQKNEEARAERMKLKN